MLWYYPSSEKTPEVFRGFLNGILFAIIIIVARPLPVPEADELITRYCEKMGIKFPITGWNFCIAFSFFRVLLN